MSVYHFRVGPRGPVDPSALSSKANRQPDWSLQTNPGAVVRSTSAESVADERVVPSAFLQENDSIEGFVQVFVQGSAGRKYLRLCVSQDDTGSMLEAFDAGQTGTVIIEMKLLIAAAAPHVLNSVDYFNAAIWNQSRGSVTVDVSASPLNLQLRAWVENSSDSITVDTVRYRFNRSGY